MPETSGRMHSNNATAIHTQEAIVHACFHNHPTGSTSFLIEELIGGRDGKSPSRLWERWNDQPHDDDSPQQTSGASIQKLNLSVCLRDLRPSGLHFEFARKFGHTRKI